LAKAWEAFRQVHAANAEITDNSSLFGLFEQHLEWAAANREPETVRVRRFYLQSFHTHLPRLTVGQLKKHHVREWLAAHPTWGPTARTMAVDSLKAALGWAADGELIVRNPLARYKKADQAGRRVTLIDRASHEALVAHFAARPKPDFARLLEVLWETGARPSELARARAEDVNLAGATVTLTKHKTVRKTRRPRVIYLSARAMVFVRGQLTAHPYGLLFPNERGGRYSPTCLANKFGGARDALGLAPDITAYSYRHTYATDWLRAGKPVGKLAELLGTSLTMIQQHYGHLAEHAGDLRAAVEGFGAGR
jgi:integrase